MKMRFPKTVFFLTSIAVALTLIASSAHALLGQRMLMAASGGSVATVTWTASAVSGATDTVYTFAGTAIGTAAANRHVVVAINNLSNTTVVRQGSTVTIGGVSATRIAQINWAAGNYPSLEIWAAPVPTGTTADIVVTWSEACVRSGVGVWAVYGSDGTAKASDTDLRTASGTTVSTSTTAAAGQVTISGVFWSNTGTAASWSSMTERYDENVAGGSYQTGADISTAGALTETVTINAATDEALMATVVMGP